ncbi:MAG: hypothetical protein K0Q52_3220 [Microbacterium sp.]|nr:hypothetical protein [Microbacterium sp.]
MGDDPRLGELPKPTALPSINGLERMPERRCAPRLHLDHRQVVAYAGDDVYLSLRTPPVSVEHGVSDAHEVLRSTLFARSAEVIFRCHPPSIVF